MPDIEINDLASKASPVGTDELEIQETGGGASKKITITQLFGALINGRGRANSAGTLQAGSVGISGCVRSTTGTYQYTLDTAVNDVNTAQMMASGETNGCEISVRMTSTTVCTVYCTVAGTLTNMGNSCMVLKEG